MSGQWEVVGKKKDKGTSKPVPQQAKGKKIANGVKVEEVLPMSQIKNLYGADRNNKENQKPQDKGKAAESAAKKPQKKPEKPLEQKPKTPKSIESALGSITATEFNGVYEKNKALFPDTPIVWLKELAQFLNSRVPVEVQDPVFSNKPENYPLSVMPTPLKNVVEKAIKDAGPDNASVFFDICLTAMANDMNKDLPALGHKFFLQHLALSNPKLATNNISKYVTLRNSYQNRQPIGLSILWALGQAGMKDLNIGMKVFQEIMLPLLEMKNYSRYVLKYLIAFIIRHEGAVLTKDQYLVLLDVVYSSKKNVPSDLSKELLELLPKLNELVTRKNTPEKYNTFIEPFLKKITLNASTISYQDQLCQVLLVALEKDPNSLGAWGKVYAKYLAASAILLKYIEQNWKTVSKKINSKAFNEVLKTFTVTNEELSLKKRKEDGLKNSIDAIKKISNKMASVNSCVSVSLRGVLCFLLPILFAFVYLDVQKNGSWNESSTARAINMTGVYKYTNKALDRAREGTLWMHGRIEEQFPGLTDRTVELAAPYVELGRDVGILVCNAAGDFKETLLGSIPIAFGMVDSYFPGLIQQVEGTGEKAWTTVVMYYSRSRDYFLNEVFVGKMAPEELQKLAKEGYEAGVEKASEYYHWVCEKVSSAIK